jgi:hypothetical protein
MAVRAATGEFDCAWPRWTLAHLRLAGRRRDPVGALSLHAGGRARAIRRAVKEADNSARSTRGIRPGSSRRNCSRARSTCWPTPTGNSKAIAQHSAQHRDQPAGSVHIRVMPEGGAITDGSGDPGGPSHGLPRSGGALVATFTPWPPRRTAVKASHPRSGYQRYSAAPFSSASSPGG